MADLVYGVSRWSNSSRASARHLDTGGGLPLCGGQGRKVLSWERETGEPTCQECCDRAKRWDAYGEDYLRQMQEQQDPPPAPHASTCAGCGEPLVTAPSEDGLCPPCEAITGRAEDWQERGAAPRDRGGEERDGGWTETWFPG